MSAPEEIRRAAALMRERATAAAEAWGVESWRHENLGYNDAHGMTYDVEDTLGAHVAAAGCEELAIHIASWHPAVALAMAKAMDDVAHAWEIADEAADGWVYDADDNHYRFEETVDGGWLAVARAYLGEQP